MVDDPAALQEADEPLDLIDRDRVADADVDAAALFERAAAVDADQLAVGIEQRPAGVAGVDRGVGLQAVGVFEQRAGRVLVAVHAGDDAVGDGRLEIVGQQERIADDVHQSPTRHVSLSPSSAAGKSSLPSSLMRATSPPGSRPTSTASTKRPSDRPHFMAGPGGAGDVEVGERVAVGRDDDAGAAALAVGVEDGDRGTRDALDRCNAGGFGGEDGGVGLGGEAGGCDAKTAYEKCDNSRPIADFGLRIADCECNPQSEYLAMPQFATCA